MAGFQGKDGNVPFPRNAQEWMAKVNPETGVNYTQTQADHIMRKDVFGHDYQTDANGAPIERGKGSALQPTAQHQQALSIAQDAELSRRMRQGWHGGLEGAFDPKQAEIDRLKAELAAVKKNKRKPARAKKPTQEEAAA